MWSLKNLQGLIYSKLYEKNHVITYTNSLLYADDWIILSRSKIRLQNCFKKHTSFILRNMDVMLKINPKKTKIMICQKRPRKSVDMNFNINNEQIEFVQQYTCLSTRLTPTENFNLALEHLKEKALHVPCIMKSISP